MTLPEKISKIKEGQIINFINYGEGLDDKGLEVNVVTLKAICVDGEWYPKSQIVDFNTSSNEILFTSWFAEKKTHDEWVNRGAPSGY